MFDIQSIAIYLGTAIISFFLAKYASRYDRKSAMWLIILLLSFVGGLRASSVGIDTETYNMIFTLIPEGNIGNIYNLEKGFVYISAGLLHIWNNPQFMFFIYALISHSLIINSLWKHREYISLQWSVFSYYVVFFSFSLNGMRQFIAVAIVIYAVTLIKEGKYVQFIIMLFIATLFHKSALIGIAYLSFEILFTRYFDKNRKNKIIIIFILLCISAYAIISDLLIKYGGYFNHSVSSIGLMTLAKALMLLASIVIIGIPRDKEQKYIYLSYRFYYFISLLLNSLNYFFLYTGRIGLYYYVFEAFYIGNVFKEKNRKGSILLIKIGYALLLIYYLYGMFTNGQGEIPYRFFWQS